MSINYYKPSEIRFDRDQVLWILNNCLWGWPQEESGYSDAPISGSVNPHMPHESEILVLAELAMRLRVCGDAGVRLRDAFLAPKRMWDIEITELTNEGHAVLNYISGVCRRWMPCEPCTTKCKRRGRKAVTWNQWWSNRNR